MPHRGRGRFAPEGCSIDTRAVLSEFGHKFSKFEGRLEEISSMLQDIAILAQAILAQDCLTQAQAKRALLQTGILCRLHFRLSVLCNISLLVFFLVLWCHGWRALQAVALSRHCALEGGAVGLLDRQLRPEPWQRYGESAAGGLELQGLCILKLQFPYRVPALQGQIGERKVAISDCVGESEGAYAGRGAGGEATICTRALG